ncbi:calcium-binding protein, partial [Streptomyces sp. NPDC059071]
DAVDGAGGDDTIDLGTDGGFGAAGDHVADFGKSTGSGRDRVTGGSADEIVLLGDSVTNTATDATAAADVVNGRGGADRIFGDNVDSALEVSIGTVGGADTLFGGDGPDHVRGGPGPDRLNGGPGTDDCDGEAGADIETACEV